MPTYITLQQIKHHHPCTDQYRKARKIFNGRKRIKVSVELAVKLAGRFDFHWLATHFLFGAARKAYDEACAAARKAYDEACAPAWKAYYEACAPAWKAYDEARAPARKAYYEARAAAFARAYLRQR